MQCYVNVLRCPKASTFCSRNGLIYRHFSSIKITQLKIFLLGDNGLTMLNMPYIFALLVRPICNKLVCIEIMWINYTLKYHCEMGLCAFITTSNMLSQLCHCCIYIYMYIIIHIWSSVMFSYHCSFHAFCFPWGLQMNYSVMFYTFAWINLDYHKL